MTDKTFERAVEIREELDKMFNYNPCRGFIGLNLQTVIDVALEDIQNKN